jgi:hypothetical protein
VELYEAELLEAARRLTASGRDQHEFSFQRSFLPPDPDGAGMFTVQYEVTVLRMTTSKSLKAVGGIGLRWVDHFEGALNDGYFD